MAKIKNLLFDIEIEVNEEKKLGEVVEQIIENTDVMNRNYKKELKLMDSVFVKGGKYKPSFRGDEVKVIDLEVSKYQVTNNLWNRIMKNTGGDMLPVVKISYWQALEFCNKLSEKYGLKPVYKINNQSIKIIELDGKEVHPQYVDFSNTEGFRLPTEVEWEWFARGGEVAIQNNTFVYTYSGSNNVDEVAVYYKNTNKVKNVGTKKSNQLGLYDCSGNVWEWCYDTFRVNINTENNEFIYDEYVNRRILRGGSWYDDFFRCAVAYRDWGISGGADIDRGFRIVRTL